MSDQFKNLNSVYYLLLIWSEYLLNLFDVLCIIMAMGLRAITMHRSDILCMHNYIIREL